jgi:hypothetical protein
LDPDRVELVYRTEHLHQGSRLLSERRLQRLGERRRISAECFYPWADPDGNANGNRHCCTNAHTFPNSHSHGYANRDAHDHADSHGYIHCRTADTFTNAHGDSHANSYAHTNPKSDAGGTGH